MPLSYRLALGEHGFPFQDRFPRFDIFVIDAFGAASDRVNRELVEYSEYARRDPVAKLVSKCQEPSWLENIRFRIEKAIKRENIGQTYSHVWWRCWWLDLQAAPVGKSVRKLVVTLGIYKKVRIANSQIKRLQQANIVKLSGYSQASWL
jgi:hypothetical protein